MAEPRRLGERPRGRADDCSRARRSGELTPGKTILDATSGNTGIAYAMVGAARGYKVKLCVPENASPERKLILRALGAELVLTSPLEGTDGAIREARRLYAEHPDRYFYPDQYSNDANWRAHYDTTGPEIIEQTGGRAHAFRRRPRARAARSSARRGACAQFNPAIQLISFQPDSPFHGLEGLKHMASAIVPAIYDPTLADEDSALSHRGRPRHGAAARARRRPARRHFVGRGAGRCAATWRSGSTAASSSRCFLTARRNT